MPISPLDSIAFVRKGWLPTLCWLLCSLLFTQLSAQRTGEWTPGTYMKQALDNTYEKASLMNALSQFSWTEKLCMAGAILDVGETISLNVELTEGVAYTFLGGGDEDVFDLDMYIVARNGEILASDIEDDDTPIPDLIAPYTGVYSVRLQLVSANSSTCFVALSLLSKQGFTIAEADYNQLSEKFFAAGGSIHQVSSGVKWHDVANQWSVFGFLLNNKQSIELENLHLGAANHYIFGSADRRVSKLDLILRDEVGQILLEDVADDPYPLLEKKTAAERLYTIELTNLRCQQRSLILVGIVTE
ncbi:MAG: hypothetical protein AAF828_06445 [Bacteroidota bacterium]